MKMNTDSKHGHKLYVYLHQWGDSQYLKWEKQAKINAFVVSRNVVIYLLYDEQMVSYHLIL